MTGEQSKFFYLPPMTNLTAAAQAVLDAINKELDEAPWDVSFLAGVSAAAALRAAVGPVVPTDKELSETYLAGYYAEENRQGPNCQIAGLRAVLAKWGKAPLLNIADELEDVKYGTYRCNLEDKPQ
jgi:hypothetical protein